MRLLDKASLTKAVWSSYSEEPIWQSPFWESRLCAPCLIMPEESFDGSWHLFAHTWLGIEHYVSTSGFDWQRVSLVAFRGHYPSLYKEKNTWYLVYEAHDNDYGNKRRLNLKKTVSRIYIMTSTDLSLWSRPQVILSAADIPYASDYSLPRLAHPQLISWNGGYRLYFTAGEVRMYDTGQKASAYLSYADGNFLTGSYEIAPRPVMGIDPDGKYSNLAVGSFSFVVCSDALMAFQCTFFFDEKERRSRSAILLLSSGDGEHFEVEKELMRSPENGWASRCFTSCTVSYRAEENTWYCYYSANGRSARHPWLPVREKLGLIIGNVKRD